MKFRKPNKRMLEYWLDEDEDGKIIPLKMPYKYVIESFCDMVGAGKAYMKDKWTPEQPYNYYKAKCENKRLMNSQSTYLLLKLINKLKELNSEKEFYIWYKENKNYLKINYNNNSNNY